MKSKKGKPIDEPEPITNEEYPLDELKDGEEPEVGKPMGEHLEDELSGEEPAVDGERAKALEQNRTRRETGPEQRAHAEILDEATGLVTNKAVKCSRSGTPCAALEYPSFEEIVGAKWARKKDRTAALMHVVYGLAIQLDLQYGRFKYGVEVLYGRAAKAGLLHNYISEVTGNRDGKYFRTGTMVVELAPKGEAVGAVETDQTVQEADADGTEAA